MGRVCEQVGQYGPQEGQGDLLCVQAEDAVEQLHHAMGPLLPRLLQQFLGMEGVVSGPVHNAYLTSSHGLQSVWYTFFLIPRNLVSQMYCSALLKNLEAEVELLNCII